MKSNRGNREGVYTNTNRKSNRLIFGMVLGSFIANGYRAFFGDWFHQHPVVAWLAYVLCWTVGLCLPSLVMYRKKRGDQNER